MRGDDDPRVHGEADSANGRSLRLRQMIEADLPAVMAIERATFPLDAWSEAMMRGELADQPRSRHYVVAEVDGQIVGYAGLAAAADQADVQTIAVLDAHQGTGIGGALLSELLAEARRRGAREIFLEVRADNPRAQGVYGHFGFEEIGLRRRYYDDGTDAIMMRRKLDG
ncbi:ribosomal protein S18-alanine N-acetyltransferase [Nonomuraea sediminis]|uniref:ribosomal protein S18-alanine N-acetyltransferase n=1 Tax=Nonomuraea sediminis TaxID=2835864 RepID=UPI0023DFDE08|nr:ribosomal protein S18-alanine N-acetyltransferase [Nonomuraea sediminis]